MQSPFRDRASRASFIRNAAAAGAGLALGGPGVARASAAGAGACGDTVQSIINTALVAEQLATTFYYTTLTSTVIIRDQRLAGPSADPNHPAAAPAGNAGNVRYLQAALDAEIKHAAALAKAGATSPATHFYFPQGTFGSLGSSEQAGTVLGVLDALETAFIGAYLAAIASFVRLGHADLAELAGEIMGVESEHRAMGRVVAGVDLANNLALERVPFTCVGDAGAALAPFLTGKGFAGGATIAVPLPDAASTATVIGTFGTRIVTTFL